VFIHLDPRRAGVVVPARFRSQPQLVLQVGRGMAPPIPDLEVDAEGIRGTLSFDRVGCHCTIPWPSVHALVGDDKKGMVWPDDVPDEVQGQMDAARGKPPMELERWCNAVVAGMSLNASLSSQRIVTEIEGQRLVLDLRRRAFGADLSIALGSDEENGAERLPAGGPYRTDVPALRTLPRVLLRQKSAPGRVLAMLGIVRDIDIPNFDFRQRVSVRSDAPADRVRASLANEAIRDAALEVFDLGFDTIGLRHCGAIVRASTRAPSYPHFEADRLWRASQSLHRMYGALV